MSDKELMYEFQSLGEDCEFSFIQRRAGAEPLEMLRFTGTKGHLLVQALNETFAAVGDPTHTVLHVSGDKEVWGLNTRYEWDAHGFGSADTLDTATYLPKFIAKMAFLRRKFLEDLEEGQKILVYKRRGVNSYAQVHAIYTALRGHGQNPLLWVTHASTTHPPGSVEHLGGGLLKGYIDKFTPYGKAAFGSDVWYDICRNAKALLDSITPMATKPPPPESVLSSDTNAWVARHATNLKRSIAMASTLTEKQKIRVDDGSIVIAEECGQENGHLRLSGMTLNGEMMEGTWFAYSKHWLPE